MRPAFLCQCCHFHSIRCASGACSCTDMFASALKNRLCSGVQLATRPWNTRCLPVCDVRHGTVSPARQLLSAPLPSLLFGFCCAVRSPHFLASVLLTRCDAGGFAIVMLLAPLRACCRWCGSQRKSHGVNACGLLWVRVCVCVCVCVCVRRMGITHYCYTKKSCVVLLSGSLVAGGPKKLVFLILGN